MRTVTDLADEALHDAREARQDLTREEGIGPELIPTIYAWDQHDNLLGTAGIDRHDNDILAQQTSILAGIRIIREGWQATTIALLAEAYTSKTPNPDLTLAQRFATDPDVHECLTLLVVNEQGEAAIAVQPFTIGIARTINWHPQEITEIEATDSPNTNLIYTTIANTPHQPTQPDRTPELACETLIRLGFTTVAYFHPLD